MAKKNDPRIVIIRNITNHGNIGFNKRTIAMACDGDYLVEVDHDDELTPDCLELLNKAFTQFPDSDFVYSHAMEEINGKEVCYGDNFAYGLGEYRDMDVLGTTRHIALTAEVNALSVRGIHALPNHVRCWKADFYRKIGGHNPELAVLDDMDILIRTFLHGKMTLVDKVLYVQHEGNSTATSRGETTQSARFKEIQRTNEYLRMKYDVDLHNRIIELGAIDPFWVNETIGSDIRRRYDKKDLVNFNHKLEC
jgi:glycosyltransferase involved in cell wall biosynthesis